MDTEMIPFIFVIGALITVVFTALIALCDYELYKCVFKKVSWHGSTSITDKAWFRVLMTPLIYFPVLNVVGLIILLYMRAMKELDIN
jgi:hypothetical protein